ncbi:hypothetical protein FZEAL_8446 [Fusarium zealandicum]|uniref:Uncharacterized protein n=1 Tax=Fusarium zealandicum TaxID=1053134 RepID=A0A8H4UEG7_9HYPO|nr:hypothetical protein FZEAL_8446 [Fusarium zealandicum]
MALAFLYSLFETPATGIIKPPKGGPRRYPDSASQIHIASYFGSLFEDEPPIDRPPSYEDGSPAKLWRIEFLFGSDLDKLHSGEPLDLDVGWTAQLSLTTWDLPGIMNNGLYLTQENVQVRDNHFKACFLEQHRRLICNRSYTVADPRWSGHLHVCSWSTKIVMDFRIHHLSPEKVLLARVNNQEGGCVYYYNLHLPGNDANCLYDDMVLDGLWPWPKREGDEAEGEGNEDQGTFLGLQHAILYLLVRDFVSSLLVFPRLSLLVRDFVSSLLVFPQLKRKMEDLVFRLRFGPPQRPPSPAITTTTPAQRSGTTPDPSSEGISRHRPPEAEVAQPRRRRGGKRDTLDYSSVPGRRGDEEAEPLSPGVGAGLEAPEEGWELCLWAGHRGWWWVVLLVVLAWSLAAAWVLKK